MKKKLKIIGIIIFILVVVILLIIFVPNKIKQIKLNNERINSSNLMEYVKNHDLEHIKAMYGDDAYDYEYLSMGYIGKDFKCDALNNKNIITIYDMYMFLEDYSIYEFSFEELYSNNQNCKKIDLNIDIKEIKNDGEIIIDTNNNLYSFNPYGENGNYLEKIDENTWGDTLIYYDYIRNENIKKLNIYETKFNEEKKQEESIGFTLKTDGNIYNQKYVSKYGGERKKINSEQKLNFEINKYGKVNDFTFGNMIYDNKTFEHIELNENKIQTITTDKGFYYLDIERTDDCIKYKDVECKAQYFESEIYKKYKNDIKYIGKTYTILKDNTIIYTDILKYDLDKEVK